MEFKRFKTVVAAQLEHIQKTYSSLFYTGVGKDTLWETYLGSFPEGSNPIFRERTEHDCNTCKQFIRAVGNVVAVTEDNQLVSIWDVSCGDYAYQQVANAMSALVKSRPIENVFYYGVSEDHIPTWRTQRVGAIESHENTNKDPTGTPKIRTWDHLYGDLLAKCLLSKVAIGERQSQHTATHDVFARGLAELTNEAFETVMELIGDNNLYRGVEFLSILKSFYQKKLDFAQLPTEQQDAFIWRHSVTAAFCARIRNSAIGTLLIDLSEGLDADVAVRKYEAVISPANYQRPMSIVTAGMIEKAKATIVELGLGDAMARRHAIMDDLNINNLIFVDQSPTQVQPDSVGMGALDALAAEVAEDVSKYEHVEKVTINDFYAIILPGAKTVELLPTAKHLGNLMSLITSQDPNAKQLFKWNNNFSWAYRGEVADSIRARVEKQGGTVIGDLRISLSWNNYDDLDLHVLEPTDYHIHFRNKGQLSPSHGMLDVDMNAGVGASREPVENVIYKDRRRMIEGIYSVIVHNYAKREDVDGGFVVEMEYLGKCTRYAFGQMLPNQKQIGVIQFKYTYAEGIQILQSIPAEDVQPFRQGCWGIYTNSFVKVKAILASPNYWDSPGVGNLHHCFILDGCQADEPVRGFFNEFLREEFIPHRKVLEMVGNKLKIPASTTPECSGLGFSQSSRTDIICRVTKDKTKIYRILV